MITTQGKYNTAIAYTDELGKGTLGQLTAICNQPFSVDSKIHVMPDAHAGAGIVKSKGLFL